MGRIAAASTLASLLTAAAPHATHDTSPGTCDTLSANDLVITLDGVDAAALVTVDDDAILVAGPTADPAAIAAKTGDVPAGGMSALRDGLDTVLRQVTGDRGERLILYWTDGQDTGSVRMTADLLETLDRTPNARSSRLCFGPCGVTRELRTFCFFLQSFAP